MSHARFHYPRVVRASTYLGVEFTTTQRLSGGGTVRVAQWLGQLTLYQIRVDLPSSATATCVSFARLSLIESEDGWAGCEIPLDTVGRLGGYQRPLHTLRTVRS